MFRCMPFFACNRQVDSLDKRQCNLTNIPDEISRYARSLEELLLDSNHIKELSKPLFRLHKLRRLQLNDNEICKIPSDISSLHNLVELDLSKNDISDLPESIKLCSSLQILNISSNPITRLPSSISQLRTLCQLGLNDISLTQLPADIGNLVNLRELEVRENLIHSLPASIAYLARLQRLDLGVNELDVLPPEIGKLSNLTELFVDNNSLETLPPEIRDMKALQSLDASENRLMELPDEIGELANLSDLTLSQNCLEVLPHSIGRLKKLTIFKVDKNRLITLTPAIGSCTAIQDLILTENLLTELPSSVGNLKEITTLHVDLNRIQELPTTIGSCTNLGVLSVRDNALISIPNEIGKLEKLRVLDVSGNRLYFLPFTIGVLNDLQALWLSENQSQPLLKLQTDQDPRTGMKVLTCYLLPQQDSKSMEDIPREPKPGKSFVGGPRVGFADEFSQDDDREYTIGKFERHDTPHPKHPHTKLQDRKHIDGHVIHHEDGDKLDPILDLRAEGERRRSSFNSQTSEGKGVETSENNSYNQQNGIESPKRVAPLPPPRQTPIQTKLVEPEKVDPEPYQRKNVGFSEETEENEEASMKSKLIRKNTPHYTKGARLDMDPNDAKEKVNQILTGSQHSAGSPAVNGMDSNHSGSRGQKFALVTSLEEQTRTIYRSDGGLGLSIAGGKDSPPYNPEKPDEEGIFISKVTEGGPADIAGLKRGDKLLAVNGKLTKDVNHEEAVNLLRLAGDAAAMRIQREILKPVSASESSSGAPSLDNSFSSATTGDRETETISTSIRRDAMTGPGFSIAGGRGAVPFRPGDDGIFVSRIAEGGPAAKDGKLRVGDRVLSINGVNMKGARHDQVVALLTGCDTEVHLVVQREKGGPLMSPLNLDTSPGQLPVSKILDGEPPLAQSSPMNSLDFKKGLPPMGSADKPKERAKTPTRPEMQWTSEFPIEEIVLSKAGGPLGLSIVGGSNHTSHPFGMTNPGVFVSKVVGGGAASRSGKLRIGDRILSVNGQDLTRAQHEVAVNCLKAAPSEVKLVVSHDPQPEGLKTVVIKKKSKDALGISICGGVREEGDPVLPPANPLDKTDEGIFIEEVFKEGAARKDGRLKPGQRILEVNDQSLLGVSQKGAAEMLKKAGGELTLVICEGIEPGSRNNSASLDSSKDDYVPPPGVRVAGQSTQPLLPPLGKEEPTLREAASNQNPSVSPDKGRFPTRSLSPPKNLKLPSRSSDASSGSSHDSEWPGDVQEVAPPSGRRPIGTSLVPKAYQSKPLSPPKPLPLTTSREKLETAQDFGVEMDLSASRSRSPIYSPRAEEGGNMKTLPPMVSPKPKASKIPAMIERSEKTSIERSGGVTAERSEKTTVTTVTNTVSKEGLNSGVLVSPGAGRTDIASESRLPPPPVAPKPNTQSNATDFDPEDFPPPPPSLIGYPSSSTNQDALGNHESSPPAPDPVHASRLPSAKPSDFSSGRNKPAAQSPGTPPSTPGSNPEKLGFTSKLGKFEAEIKKQTTSTTSISTNVPGSKLPKPAPPPKKFAYLSQDEIMRMKEEEQAKIDHIQQNLLEDLNKENDKKSKPSGIPTGPAIIRTKKAENREKNRVKLAEDETNDLSPAEQRAFEAEKRAAWRQARLKSLEADAMKAELVMQKVRQLADVSESSESVQHSDTTETTERKVLKMEVSDGFGSDIGFIDDGSARGSHEKINNSIPR